MRKIAYLVATVLAVAGTSPTFAMTVPNVEAASAAPIVLAGTRCGVGYSYNSFTGRCRSSQFGFARGFYPGRRCVVRPTAYGPRRICR